MTAEFSVFTITVQRYCVVKSIKMVSEKQSENRTLFAFEITGNK